MARRLTLFMAAALVGLALAATPAAAQDQGAGVLYFVPSEKATALPDPDCVSVPFHGLSPSLDPAAESVDLAAGTSLVGASCPAVFEYEVTDPASLSGTLTAHFFVECAVVSVDGGLGLIGSFAYEVTKNGDPVSDTFFGSAPLGDCADGDVIEIVETGIPSGDTQYATGDVLGLNLIMFAGPHVPGAADTISILAGSLDHPSRIMGAGLPSSGDQAPVGPLVDQLHGDELDLSFGVANRTNQSYVFHWESPLSGSAQIVYDVNLTSGSMAVSVRDGSNATMLDETFQESESRRLPVEASPGNWTIRLDLVDAAGGLRLQALVAAAEDSPEPTPTDGPDSDGTTPSPTGNATDGNASDLDSDAGLPGPSLVLIVAALGMAAWVAVRRRR